MRIFIIQLALLCIAMSSFAQKIGDTLILSVDTINIRGKVITEDGSPIAKAEIIAEAFGMKARYNNGYRTTKTDKNGNFTLNGIKHSDTLFIYSSFGKEIIINNGSRNLLITVKKSNIIKLNYSKDLSITAIRKTNKPSYLLKLIYAGNWYHPEGLYDQPTYPGGQGKFIKLIKDNVKYPEAAINNNIEGNVIVEFTIDSKGFVKDTEIIRDIGYDCGKEVLKVLNLSNKWNPAMQNGKPIEKRFSLEIPFKFVD